MNIKRDEQNRYIEKLKNKRNLLNEERNMLIEELTACKRENTILRILGGLSAIINIIIFIMVLLK